MANLLNFRRLLLAITSTGLFPTAHCLAQTISISPIQNLSFGSFAAISGGTVIIAATGVRSSSGGISLISSDSGSMGQFNVSGTPNGTYSIALSQSTLLTSGGNSMTANAFTSNPSVTGPITNVSSKLSIGATLIVKPNQPPGFYQGTFSVTVIHN